MILQGVVDHKMKFWDISIGQPGRVHDGRVFALSSLFDWGQRGALFPQCTETFEGINVPLVILGYAAYPLLPSLMKPFWETRATQEQMKFNYHLSQARMTIERAFGRLKGHWRCLLKQNETHITLVSQVISACCVVHNFCEAQNEEYDEEGNIVEGEDEVNRVENGESCAGQRPAGT